MSLIDNLNLKCKKQNFLSESDHLILELFSVDNDPINICKQLDYNTNKVLSRHYWINNSFECAKFLHTLDIVCFGNIRNTKMLKF